MAEQSNDNDGARTSRPTREQDPHGRAALLLVESLLHGLIENAALTIQEAVEIVDTAMEVKLESAAETDNHSRTTPNSLTLLSAISESLRQDIV